MKKRKIGLGKTALRLIDVDLEDEVVQGVLDARNSLGGQFPEHVRSITVHKEALVPNAREPWVYTNGECTDVTGNSKIDIYEGSIIRTGPIHNLRGFAQRVTRHEIDHANHGRERQDGAWFNGELSIAEQEARAENFEDDF